MVQEKNTNHTHCSSYAIAKISKIDRRSSANKQLYIAEDNFDAGCVILPSEIVLGDNSESIAIGDSIVFDAQTMKLNLIF